MRILHITDRMHAASGISQLLLTYSKNMHMDNIYFDYLVESYDETTYNEVTMLGGHFFLMPKLGIGSIKKCLTFFKKFFLGNNYDIVHSHYYQIDTMVIPCAYKSGVSHYISHSHNPHYSDYLLRSIRNCLLSLPIRFMASEFFACSQESGDFLYGKLFLKLRRKSVFVLPNAIDYTKFYYNETIRVNVRKELNIKDEKVIGIVGSLRPQKNQKFLLKVTKYIYDKFDKNIRLVMVGDGGDRVDLQSLIKEYNLSDNVIITGFTDSSWLYYNAFDCYVLPSLYEGFGLSLLEAQVNSLRCVCSSVIPNDPIISEHVTKLSLSDNLDHWAKVIYMSATEGRAFGKLTDAYNIKIQSKRLSNYYIDILK